MNPTRLGSSLRVSLAAAVASAALIASGTSLAVQDSAGVQAPPSRPIPTGDAWQLDFKPGPLRVYVDPFSGQAYWYLTYEIENRTGRERTWAPRFELQSDAGLMQSSGQEVPQIVTQDLQRVLSNPRIATRTGRILDQNQVIGPIVSGPEHVREGVVIWPIEDPRVTQLTIYVAGVTNRRESMPHPESGEPIVLRQERALRYLTPGDLAPLQGQPIQATEGTWVLR